MIGPRDGGHPAGEQRAYFSAFLRTRLDAPFHLDPKSATRELPTRLAVECAPMTLGPEGARRAGSTNGVQVCRAASARVQSSSSQEFRCGAAATGGTIPSVSSVNRCAGS